MRTRVIHRLSTDEVFAMWSRLADPRKDSDWLKKTVDIVPPSNRPMPENPLRMLKPHRRENGSAR